MARIQLNGQTRDVAEGATLLEALRANGLDVPTLCHDDRMDPASACRLCEVEVDGSDRPLCACATPVVEGMSVRTHTPALEDYRRGLLEMLARHYPAEAMAQDPERPFHHLLTRYGVEPTGITDPAKIDATHPYLHLDMNRCVNCYRCVRICEEVQGQFVWKVVERGGDTHVAPSEASRLQDSPCVSCGACSDTCPTGAIQDQTRHQHGPADHWTRTICPYCGTGCELEVGTHEGRIVEVRPSLESPVNQGHLCVKGRFGLGFGEAADRVLHPMVRRDGEWVEVSWDEALDEAVALLTRVRDTYGPQALGVLGSSRGSNEEAFLTQKLARVALGTGNVDCCARVCHAPSAAGLGLVLGTGAATNSFADIERASLIMVVGANPTDNHPIVGNRIKHQALAGIPLIVIDPRRTELAQLATVHLAPEPGTNIPLLQAIAHVILEEGLEDRAFLQERAEGLEAFVDSLKTWTPERAGAICGIEPEAIRKAARLYATVKPGYMCNGLGITEQIQGTDSIMALANLALITGNLGLEGAGVNPLRGQNNVQGCAQMGCEPRRLTGYQPYDLVRERHEELWGPLPGPGLDLLEMLDAAHDGRFKALLTFGYDVYLSNPDAHRTAEALGRLEGLIAIDPFLTETAKAFATVFLPAATPLEKDGTFMNGERRVQRIRKALPPPGEARNDLEIVCALADRLGFATAFTYDGPEAVWNEVRALWPAVAGISYPRIEAQGIQWPCPAEIHPGTEVLHADKFPVGQRATLRVLDWIPSAQRRGDGFPYLLNTGRSLEHFNAGTMTGRTRNLELEPDDILEIHPGDAAALGLKEGDRVRVESRHGGFEAEARITERVRAGEPFAVFHSPQAFVNRATGPGRDPRTHTPEFKRTAVRLSRI